METRRPWLRTALGIALALVLVAAPVPLVTGYWEPAWLRLAADVTVDLSAGSTVELGEAQAPFRVEQRDAAGRVVWRLAGGHVRRADADLLTHDIEAPRLILFQGDAPALTLTAGRGRLRLPEGLVRPDEREPRSTQLQLELEDGVAAA